MTFNLLILTFNLLISLNNDFKPLAAEKGVSEAAPPLVRQGGTSPF